MKTAELKLALACAVKAAQQAGAVSCAAIALSPRKSTPAPATTSSWRWTCAARKSSTRILLGAFPASGLLGEEGMAGATGTPLRWVVDPIDGTVNFTYGVPHACVSIALQERGGGAADYATIARRGL
jgi:myo-inositol-1(or 4)-monophosphatase